MEKLPLSYWEISYALWAFAGHDSRPERRRAWMGALSIGRNLSLSRET